MALEQARRRIEERDPSSSAPRRRATRRRSGKRSVESARRAYIEMQNPLL
jgi:hypothetical protein